MELSFILILLIVLAGFIKGFIGFGLSLILISVLFEAGFKPSEFLPIIVPIFVMLDILLYFENRKIIHLDFKENFTLHPTTLMTLFIGILFGTYLLNVIDSSALKISFAILILIIIFTLIGKVDNSAMKIPSEMQNGFFGLGSGVLTGLFTMNAVPSSLYLLHHQYPKEKYLASLITFLLFSDLILVAVYLFKELFSFELFKISFVFLFITITGFLAGSYLRKFVPTRHFKAIVILILAVNSIKIIYNYFIF